MDTILGSVGVDIVSFRQESRWYGLFLGSFADLFHTAFFESLEISSPILFGIAHCRKHPKQHERQDQECNS